MTSHSAPAPGYRSAEAKSRFILIAIILSGVFFIAQFVGPLIMMLTVMPFPMFGGNSSFDIYDADTGVYWKGEVWWVARITHFGPEGGNTRHLCHAPVAGEEDAKTGPEIDYGYGRLLAGPDRLWLISATGVQSYRDGEITVHEGAQELYEISEPFLLSGRPAVVEFQEHGMVVQTWKNDHWEAGEMFTPIVTEDLGPYVLYPVSDGTTIHFFAEVGREVYYWKGIDRIHAGEWERVTTARRNWSATLVDDEPVVVIGDLHSFPPRAVAYQRTNGAWEKFFEQSLGFAGDFHARPHPDAGTFLLLVEPMPGSTKVLKVKDGEVVERGIVRGGFGFEKFFQWILLASLAPLFLSVIYVLILSSMMARHREPDYTAQKPAVPFASLARRAIARVIDGMILGAPLLAGYSMMFSLFTGGEMPFGLHFAWMFVLMIGGFGWLLVGILVISYFEGKTGTSPGKSMMGIRLVGLDLQPCGFGRAFLRHLLMIADSFMGSMVGILCIAFTARRQRVGDMAVKTIVVMKTNR